MVLLRRPRAKVSLTVPDVEPETAGELLEAPLAPGHPTPQGSKIECISRPVTPCADGSVVPPEPVPEPAGDKEIATGPEPFPYRIPKKGQFTDTNPLIEFTGQLEPDLLPPKPAHAFALEDFLLRHKPFIPTVNKRETSTQNYELSYQRNEYQKNCDEIAEITRLVDKDVLTVVDVNTLAALDPTPRRIPPFLQRLTRQKFDSANHVTAGNETDGDCWRELDTGLEFDDIHV